MRFRFLAIFTLFLSLSSSAGVAVQQRKPESPTRGFQVILLTASHQGDSGVENLPENAQNALRDLRKMLPFKSYQMTDMALQRTSETMHARLTGTSGQKYALGLTFREGGSSPGKRLFIDSFSLIDESSRPPLVAGETPRPTPSLISTSFGMDVGETVVVGVSNLSGGNEAIVVLLTALP